MFGSRTMWLHFPVGPSGVPFVTLLTSPIPHLGSQLPPLGFFISFLQKMNMNYTTNFEYGEVCEFEKDPGLFLYIVQTAGINAQVQMSQGVPITANLYRKLAYRAYIVSVFGWLGRGNRRPPQSLFC
jgi:hypothetical protein